MSDEELMAYVDGELAGDARAHVEAAMATDPQLQRRVLEMQKQAAALNAAFAPVLDEPLPERLRNIALSHPVSWRYNLREILARRRSAGFSLPQFATAAAAALLIGIVAGRLSGDSSQIASSDGVTVARGDLARGLEARLASDTSGATRIGVSFRNTAGAACRTFNIGRTAGIACKAGDTWRIAALAENEADGAGDFHVAAAAMPQTIRTAVTHMMHGDAFDAEQERRARDAGWK